MSWDSFSKSLGSIIEERLFSPLVSGFIISWSILNWKFWAFVFWSKDLDDLFNRVTGLRETPYDFALYYFVAPFTFAVGYVYILPKLSRPVTRRWRENQKQIEDDRKDVEALELLDLPKSQALRAENYKLRAQVDELGAERDEAKEDAKNAGKVQRAAEAQRDASANESAAAIERFNQVKSQLQSLSTELADRERDLAETRKREALLQSQLSIINGALEESKKKLFAEFAERGASEAGQRNAMNDQLALLLLELKATLPGKTINVEKIVDELKEQHKAEREAMMARVEEMLTSAQTRNANVEQFLGVQKPGGPLFGKI